MDIYNGSARQIIAQFLSRGDPPARRPCHAFYRVWTWAQRALLFAFDRACRDDKGFPEIRGNHQCSLVSADAHIALQNNPRRLGNANYAGYDDAWTFKYVVGNLSEWGLITFHSPLSNSTDPAGSSS